MLGPLTDQLLDYRHSAYQQALDQRNYLETHKPPPFCPGIGREWINRDGSRSSVHFPVVDNDWEAAEMKLEKSCRSFGWEGHPGGGWNYFKDDAKVAWSKFWNHGQ